jgi:TldD protein
MKALVIAVVASSSIASAGPLDDETVVRAMKDEIARSIAKLELPGLGKPYFLAYELWDLQDASASASLGVLTRSSEFPRRYIDIDLRVGDYTEDNSNYADTFGRRHSLSISKDSDYGAIRRALWLSTDAAYKAAGESFERKKAVKKEEIKAKDDAAAFTKDTAAKIVDEAKIVAPDRAKLEALVTKLSEVFRHNPDVYGARASVNESRGNRYFVSSEGALAVQPEGAINIIVECDSQADDGMPLHDETSFHADSFDQLPTEAEMLAQVDKLSKELSALRKAPIVDDYAGPVLFAGVAAGEITRALLAENLSGTPAPKGDRPGMRQIGESELVGKTGQRILPPGVTVVDDPTIARAGKTPLVGHYRFDEEGIAAQKVVVIDNGVFKQFLMSRTPRKGIDHSNGHGRSTPRAPIRAHPSNLILTSTRAVTDRELVTRAIAAAKEQGLAYAIVVDKIGIGRADFDDIDPAAFAGGSFIPKPTVMKRVYPDGHEELVRGGSLGSIQLRAMKDLVAIGTTAVPYHYAGSGLGPRFDLLFGSSSGIAISILSPSLLFRDIDVKKPLGAQKKPPIAPRPVP